MSASLVGSEMCIRDRPPTPPPWGFGNGHAAFVCSLVAGSGESTRARSVCLETGVWWNSAACPVTGTQCLF
eukprot:7905214-Alexandrium_andersonii.AAC.1